MIILDSPWDKAIGPIYTVASLAKALGVDESKIAEWQAKGRLLALETANQHLVFPAFQFDSQMKVIPGLLKVWQILEKADVTDWTMASWLNSPLQRGGEESILDLLKTKEGLRKALFEANDIVRVWME